MMIIVIQMERIQWFCKCFILLNFFKKTETKINSFFLFSAKKKTWWNDFFVFVFVLFLKDVIHSSIHMMMMMIMIMVVRDIIRVVIYRSCSNYKFFSCLIMMMMNRKETWLEYNGCICVDQIASNPWLNDRMK